MASEPVRKSLGQILTGDGIISGAELEEAVPTHRASGLRRSQPLQKPGAGTVADVDGAPSVRFDLPLLRHSSEWMDLLQKKR